MMPDVNDALLAAVLLAELVIGWPYANRAFDWMMLRVWGLRPPER